MTLSAALMSADSAVDGPPAAQRKTISMLRGYVEASSLSSSVSCTSKERAEVLWRLARAHERLWQAAGGQEAQGKNKRESSLHLDEGFAYAEAAVAVDASNGNAHKYFALYLGMQAATSGMAGKVKAAEAIDKHTRIALSSLPGDSTLHHMMGRLCVSFAAASWAQRTAARAVGFTIPKSTFVEAVSHFARATELDPTPTNCLWLAKATLLEGKGKSPQRQQEARELLARAIGMSEVGVSHLAAQLEAKAELAKLSKSRL